MSFVAVPERAELLRSGDRRERQDGKGHREIAINQLCGMKMQPSLERALGVNALLHT
jgi:hypothetical protein